MQIINDRRSTTRMADTPNQVSDKAILMGQFLESIVLMNETYKLPAHDTPVFYNNMKKRLDNFRTILLKEQAELTDLINKVPADLDKLDPPKAIDRMVDLADFLGDMVVYCFSEAAKYGIDLPEVLKLIQISNCTKLDADGEPIKDANGKFLKGPNFVPPEPAIREFFLKQLNGKASVTK